jgi:hypothetical protein
MKTLNEVYAEDRAEAPTEVDRIYEALAEADQVCADIARVYDRP